MKTEEIITVAPSKSSIYNFWQDTVRKSDISAVAEVKTSKLISDRPVRLIPSPTISHDDRRVTQSGGCLRPGKDITKAHVTRQAASEFFHLQLSQSMIGFEIYEYFQKKVGNFLLEMITKGVKPLFGKSLFLLQYLLHPSIARAALFLDTTQTVERNGKTLAFLKRIDKDFDCVSCIFKLGQKLLQLEDHILGIRIIIEEYLVAATKNSDVDDETWLGLVTYLKLKALLCSSPQYMSNRKTTVIYEGKESEISEHLNSPDQLKTEHLKSLDQLQLQSKTDEVGKLVARLMKFHRLYIDCRRFQECHRIFAEMLKQNKFRDKDKIREFFGQMERAFDLSIAEDTEMHSQNKNMLNLLEGNNLASVTFLATFCGGYETLFKQNVGQIKDYVSQLFDVSKALLAQMLCQFPSSCLQYLLKTAGSRTETIFKKHFEQIQDKIQQVYDVGIAQEIEIKTFTCLIEILEKVKSFSKVPDERTETL